MQCGGLLDTDHFTFLVWNVSPKESFFPIYIYINPNLTGAWGDV